MVFRVFGMGFWILDIAILGCWDGILDFEFRIFGIRFRILKFGISIFWFFWDARSPVANVNRVQVPSEQD